MGGRGSSSGGGFGGGGTSAQQFQIQQVTNLQPTQSAAQAVNKANFSDKDDADYHDMYNGRNYFNKQGLTIDQQLATINYLSDQPESGSLYSMSQNMNHALATGQKLNANQQYVNNHLMSAMHNLGYNTNLTRYDHAPMIDNLLASAGLNKGYQSYSETQLKNALVGMKYGERKFISTSYNDFKNAPASTSNVFQSRAVKITYKAKAGVQAMMPGNGPGGQIGEILLAPSGGTPNFKILDVKFTGKSARQKQTQSYNMKQVEIVVEVDPQ